MGNSDHLVCLNWVPRQQNRVRVELSHQPLMPDVAEGERSVVPAEGFEDGVLDEGVHFIQKPASRSDLAAKVKAVLGEARR